MKKLLLNILFFLLLECFVLESYAVEAPIITKEVITKNSVNVLDKKITPAILDQLWTSYFKTSNEIYLRKMIEYINENDYLLILGYEIFNRNFICDSVKRAAKLKDKQDLLNRVCGKYDDIFKTIKKRYPKNNEAVAEQVMTISAAIWSLEANRKQDPVVDEKIKKIISDKPEWDYWKKIEKVVRK